MPTSRPLAPPPSVTPALGTRDFERTTLKGEHRRILRALGEAMFAPEDAVAEARLDRFVDEVDRYISPASKTLRFGLVVMLSVIRWSPLLFLNFRRFDDLGIEERVRHLERLEASKVKQLPLLVVAYKAVLSMVFYEDETELRTLGYPGPDRTRWRQGRSLPLAKGTSAHEESAA